MQSSISARPDADPAVTLDCNRVPVSSFFFRIYHWCPGAKSVRNRPDLSESIHQTVGRGRRGSTHVRCCDAANATRGGGKVYIVYAQPSNFSATSRSLLLRSDSTQEAPIHGHVVLYSWRTRWLTLTFPETDCFCVLNTFSQEFLVAPLQTNTDGSPDHSRAT